MTYEERLVAFDWSGPRWTGKPEPWRSACRELRALSELQRELDPQAVIWNRYASRDAQRNPR